MVLPASTKLSLITDEDAQESCTLSVDIHTAWVDLTAACGYTPEACILFATQSVEPANDQQEQQRFVQSCSTETVWTLLRQWLSEINRSQKQSENLMLEKNEQNKQRIQALLHEELGQIGRRRKALSNRMMQPLDRSARDPDAVKKREWITKLIQHLNIRLRHVMTELRLASGQKDVLMPALALTHGSEVEINEIYDDEEQKGESENEITILAQTVTPSASRAESSLTQETFINASLPAMFGPPLASALTNAATSNMKSIGTGMSLSANAPEWFARNSVELRDDILDRLRYMEGRIFNKLSDEFRAAHQQTQNQLKIDMQQCLQQELASMKAKLDQLLVKVDIRDETVAAAAAIEKGKQESDEQQKLVTLLNSEIEMLRKVLDTERSNRDLQKEIEHQVGTEQIGGYGGRIESSVQNWLDGQEGHDNMEEYLAREYRTPFFPHGAMFGNSRDAATSQHRRLMDESDYEQNLMYCAANGREAGYSADAWFDDGFGAVLNSNVGEVGKEVSRNAGNGQLATSAVSKSNVVAGALVTTPVPAPTMSLDFPAPARISGSDSSSSDSVPELESVSSRGSRNNEDGFGNAMRPSLCDDGMSTEILSFVGDSSRLPHPQPETSVVGVELQKFVAASTENTDEIETSSTPSPQARPAAAAAEQQEEQKIASEDSDAMSSVVILRSRSPSVLSYAYSSSASSVADGGTDDYVMLYQDSKPNSSAADISASTMTLVAQSPPSPLQVSVDSSAVVSYKLDDLASISDVEDEQDDDMEFERLRVEVNEDNKWIVGPAAVVVAKADLTISASSSSGSGSSGGFTNISLEDASKKSNETSVVDEEKAAKSLASSMDASFCSARSNGSADLLTDAKEGGDEKRDDAGNVVTAVVVGVASAAAVVSPTPVVRVSTEEEEGEEEIQHHCSRTIPYSNNKAAAVANTTHPVVPADSTVLSLHAAASRAVAYAAESAAAASAGGVSSEKRLDDMRATRCEPPRGPFCRPAPRNAVHLADGITVVSHSNPRSFLPSMPMMPPMPPMPLFFGRNDRRPQPYSSSSASQQQHSSGNGNSFSFFNNLHPAEYQPLLGPTIAPPAYPYEMPPPRVPPHTGNNSPPNFFGPPSSMPSATHPKYLYMQPQPQQYQHQQQQERRAVPAFGFSTPLEQEQQQQAFELEQRRHTQVDQINQRRSAARDALRRPQDTMRNGSNSNSNNNNIDNNGSDLGEELVLGVGKVASHVFDALASGVSQVGQHVKGALFPVETTQPRSATDYRIQVQSAGVSPPSSTVPFSGAFPRPDSFFRSNNSGPAPPVMRRNGLFRNNNNVAGASSNNNTDQQQQQPNFQILQPDEMKRKLQVLGFGSHARDFQNPMDAGAFSAMVNNLLDHASGHYD